MVIILCKQGKMRFLPAHAMQPRIATLVALARPQDWVCSTLTQNEGAGRK